MNTMYTIWIVLQILIAFNLVFPLLLFACYKLIRPRNASSSPDAYEADYAVIVTAYEQVDMLPTVVNSLLQMNYKNYTIYIVADNCDVSGLKFESEKVVLLRPAQVIASNTGSHFYAVDRFIRPHERLTIIDSDNLVSPDYLPDLNQYFDRGFKAVQGVREAKNLNTMYACLDAARDKYYHYYDGKLLFGAGSSATLAGSGMAFDVELYKDCLQSEAIKGAGFDKVLQYKIVERGERIAFAEEAVVYDEKTAKPDQLVKQRARWIYTWFKYSWFGLKLIGKGITSFNWNQALFGLVLLRPPLFIFLLLSLLCFSINAIVAPLAALVWLLALLGFVTGFFLALSGSGTDQRIYASLAGIPRFMFYQLCSLIKAVKVNKLTVATRHDTTV